MKKAFIASSGMLTPYGMGTASTWEGLVSGRQALSSIERFDVSAMRAGKAGLVEGLEYHSGSSLVMQMCQKLLHCLELPKGTRLYLATTKGEIDLLEQDILNGAGETSGRSNPAVLLGRLGEMLGCSSTNGMVVSAACASSTSALALAASEVSSGRSPAALVVGCDSVSEFVYSGFSSLMALDALGARPFDADRAGLSVGEAAAYALVVSGELLHEYSNERPMAISGWGMSSDANHMTGPSRDGQGLWQAIERALEMSGVRPEDMGSISAHGTGTVYNDSMELKAFNKTFKAPVPVYSVKGGMGHSMGAAGIVEALLAGHSLYEGKVPPTVGLMNTDNEASGWVSTEPQPTQGAPYALTTNSGFGGINAALVLGAAQ